jgi:hypothetical protein
MKTFCTIITKNYLPYAIALYKSIERFDKQIQLQVLVVDGDVPAEIISGYNGITIIPVHTIMEYNLVKSLHKKYVHTSTNSFRWALKPVLISYLLEQGFKKVLYTDCDIFFYEDYRFLFDDLDISCILLTPHWRTSDPLVDELAFLSLFTDGIYNAGFIGANREGLPALSWWALACHYRMETNEDMALKDDQSYLDVVPVKFENVKIIRHMGCNISAWNQFECKRVLVGDKVLINGIYTIVFMHYNKRQFIEILKGHDKLLLPYLQQFKKTFEENGDELSSFHKDFNHYYTAGPLLKLKWKLMIRTRIKRFLFLMAQKI